MRKVKLSKLDTKVKKSTMPVVKAKKVKVEKKPMKAMKPMKKAKAGCACG